MFSVPSIYEKFTWFFHTLVVWTATGGATPPPSFPPNPLSQALSPTITVTQSASYIATITYRGGCVDRDTIQIRMQTPDTLRVSPDPVSVCLGDTLNLTATSALNLLITWHSGAPLTGTLLGTGSSLAYIPTPPAGQTSLYVVTTDSPGCTYIDTVAIDVLEEPDFTITPTPATCRGQNNGSIAVTPNAAGTYNYTLYNAAGGVVAGPTQTGQFANLAPGRISWLCRGLCLSPARAMIRYM